MIYELRQYTVAAGRMEECQRLFQDVIDPLFKEVGIRPVGYWQPTERDGQTFIYLLAFRSAASREAIWPRFIEHPRWHEAKSRFPDGVRLTKKWYPQSSIPWVILPCPDGWIDKQFQTETPAQPGWPRI